MTANRTFTGRQSRCSTPPRTTTSCWSITTPSSRPMCARAVGVFSRHIELLMSGVSAAEHDRLLVAEYPVEAVLLGKFVRPADPSPLESRYFSGTPYALGDRAVKYQLLPRPENPGDPHRAGFAQLPPGRGSQHTSQLPRPSSTSASNRSATRPQTRWKTRPWRGPAPQSRSPRSPFRPNNSTPRSERPRRTP